MSEHTPDFEILEVRKWDGEQWPESRISIGCKVTGMAVMISPRYAELDQSEANARHIVHCVNNHERLVEALATAATMLEVACYLGTAGDIRNLLAELEATK